MHLGIFGYFLGGLNRGGVLGFDRPEKRATLSNEWAGLIGQNFHDFVLITWSVFGPVLGFFFVIFIVNMIKKELEENISGMQVRKKKREKNREAMTSVSPMKQGMFDFVHKL
ncbi:hypothetical protein L1999_13215 [Neobacillus drentensis]|uniref:hypothetical protein n=1 Tax=Neobacillus drentensis TaxID=220684 RepID=UPI001F2BDC5F|nr:hypothetical protein [Neobacillus drentensis]ULT59422.1 hypothetical protein L1999_13215 [Neobacillus drentensis]